MFVVLGDQATKLFIKGFSIPALGIHVKGIPIGSTIPVLGNFCRLTYIENPGMAFGIDVGGKLFFSLFSVIASIGILFYLYKMRNERLLFRFSLALILGGAIGNLIDRVFYGVLFNDGGLFYGKVVDFIDIDFFNVSHPRIPSLSLAHLQHCRFFGDSRRFDLADLSSKFCDRGRRKRKAFVGTCGGIT